jgi:hypothetical protein
MPLVLCFAVHLHQWLLCDIGIMSCMPNQAHSNAGVTDLGR